jgi:hypothetical protein
LKSATTEDAQTEADFDKEFEKLRQGGDTYGDVYISPMAI